MRTVTNVFLDRILAQSKIEIHCIGLGFIVLDINPVVWNV